MNHDIEEEARKHLKRGTAYAEQGKYNKAIKAFDKTIELVPTDIGVYVNRGFAYEEQGKHKKAMKDYNRAISLNFKSKGYDPVWL